jgi:putative tricarboxylic transport membrane protein
MKAERIASVAFLVFAIAYFILAFFIRQPLMIQILGPDVFPKAIGILLMLLSAIYVYQQFRGKTQEDEARAAIIGADEKLGSKFDAKTVGLMLGLMLLYAFFFERLGYPIATFLMFMACVYVLDRRHLRRDLVIAMIISFGLYFIFVYLLRVQLPTGPLRLIGLR